MQRLKNKLYAYIFWQSRIGDVLNAIYGMRIFLKNSFLDDRLITKENYEAYLTKQYHIIEKGLALPSPRANFGKAKILKLLSVSEKYVDSFGETKLSSSIKEALKSYLGSNPTLQVEDPSLYKAIVRYAAEASKDKDGGVYYINKENVEAAIDIDFEKFLITRSSVRDFSSEPVTSDELFKAVSLARNAPSVCNRQSWRIHTYSDRRRMAQLLRIQNGNGGFGDVIDKLLIITTDTRKFTKLEGNQIFVDGGIFAMNVVLSLHSLGIGSCCLNTCVPYVDEKAIKKIGEIPTEHRVIMMIGVGKLKTEYKVALSKKLDVDHILTEHRD